MTCGIVLIVFFVNDKLGQCRERHEKLEKQSKTHGKQG